VLMLFSGPRRSTKNNFLSSPYHFLLSIIILLVHRNHYTILSIKTFHVHLEIVTKINISYSRKVL
jgi:hypothetical protein